VKQKLVISENEQMDGDDDLSNQFLLDRLDSFKTGPASNQYNMIPFPPQFQTAPCKPILFDLAFNHLQSPNLGPRIPKVKPKTIEVKKTGETKKEIKTKSPTTTTQTKGKEKDKEKNENDKDQDKEKDKDNGKKGRWFSSIWGGST